MLEKLIKLATKAKKKGEVPVAALIVKNNVIISTAYNKKEKTNNPLMHAEILCIIKASKKIKNWRLNDCEMYVTLEPCDMCKKIIDQSRIKKVNYLCEQKNKNFVSNTVYNKLNTKESYIYSQDLINFFKAKR